MGNLQNNSFRFERKFVLTPVQSHRFIAELYFKNFTEIFRKRKINNIYFDNPSFDGILDNIEGLSNRKKHRLRWYGSTFKKSKKTYEIKIKREFLNTKKNITIGVLPFKEFADVNSLYNDVVDFLKKNQQHHFLQTLLHKKPTLVNSYQRKYFLNSNGNIRITIDSDLKYYSPITKIHTSELNIMVEIKYDKVIDIENEFNNLIYTRYSKYVKGYISSSVFKPHY